MPNILLSTASLQAKVLFFNELIVLKELIKMLLNSAGCSLMLTHLREVAPKRRKQTQHHINQTCAKHNWQQIDRIHLTPTLNLHPENKQNETLRVERNHQMQTEDKGSQA